MLQVPEDRRNQDFIEDQQALHDEQIVRNTDSYTNPFWDKMRDLEVKKILGLIPNAPQRVVNLGCGTGYHDFQFALSTKTEEIIGVDISDKTIAFADAQYPHQKISRYQGDITDYKTLANLGQFDLVCSFQVFEHLSDPMHYIDTCINLARDGGSIAIVTPNWKRLENRLLPLLGKKPIKITNLHFKEYTIKELIVLGTENNMQYIGSFGHTLKLKFKQLALIDNQSNLGIRLGQLLPGWASVIGVVFQKNL